MKSAFSDDSVNVPGTKKQQAYLFQLWDVFCNMFRKISNLSNLIHC